MKNLKLLIVLVTTLTMFTSCVPGKDVKFDRNHLTIEEAQVIDSIGYYQIQENNEYIIPINGEYQKFYAKTDKSIPINITFFVLSTLLWGVIGIALIVYLLNKIIE